MNKQRRKEIEECVLLTLTTAKQNLKGILDKEHEYIDTMPNGLRLGERAVLAKTNFEILQDIQYRIENEIFDLNVLLNEMRR